jgi:hypothetical protein
MPAQGLGVQVVLTRLKDVARLTRMHLEIYLTEEMKYTSGTTARTGTEGKALVVSLKRKS